MKISVGRVGAGASRRALSLDGHINIAAEKERQSKIELARARARASQAVDRGIVDIA